MMIFESTVEGYIPEDEPLDCTLMNGSFDFIGRQVYGTETLLYDTLDDYESGSFDAPPVKKRIHVRVEVTEEILDEEPTKTVGGNELLKRYESALEHIAEGWICLGPDCPFCKEGSTHPYTGAARLAREALGIDDDT